jgi:hypothetical protein
MYKWSYNQEFSISKKTVWFHGSVKAFGDGVVSNSRAYTLHILRARGRGNKLHLHCSHDYNLFAFVQFFSDASRVTVMTDKGKPCTFPFVYNDGLQFDCAYTSAGKAWCAMTANYAKNNEWGYCDASGRSNPRPLILQCMFKSHPSQKEL